MSWPAPSYGAEHSRRRSSRSRSPDRRYFDRYERDRDAGRERDWSEYDRDRAEWDYRRANPVGVNQRDRSPRGFDDRGGKRRRSPSPFDRDRFDARGRFGDDHSEAYYRGSSPRRGFRGHSPPRINRGPTDPRDLDYPANFRYFNEWFRLNFPGQAAEEDALMKSGELDADGKPLNPMKKRYEEYRRTIVNQQIQILFDHHRHSPWFVERYDLSPHFVELRARVRATGWNGRIDRFNEELEQGNFDPVLKLDAVPVPDATGGATSDNAADNVDVEMSGIPNDDSRPEDDMDIVMYDQDPSGDAIGNGKTSDKQQSQSATPEEVSVMPEGNQIMIRTIPPDIGRAKIEEVISDLPGFMYLALGDPMQKRNYYRCGWIRFADDIDVADTVAKLTDIKVDGFRLQVTHSTRPFVSKARVAPSIASQPERVIKDLENMRKLAVILEHEAATLAQREKAQGFSQEGEGTNDEPDRGRGRQAVERQIEKLSSDLQAQFSGADEEAIIAKKNSIALDLYLAYLRTAFNCCYYCAAVADHSEELLRKCIKHVRLPPSNSTHWKDLRWAEWLDSKVALLIDRDNVDPTKYGGKDYDKELARACEPHIKHEDENKYRCTVCSKLFKASSFVEKHIANKHPELVQMLNEIPFFNHFALDPHRIQPFAHAPPNTGGQQAPPQAYGLRGPATFVPPDLPRMYAQPYGTGYPDHFTHTIPPPPYSRRRSPPHRRLSDRLGDQQSTPLVLSGIEGLPPKPVIDVNADNSSQNRRGRTLTAAQKPAAAIKEDPRAAAGRKVSYHDMDEVAEGDIELSY
ncbi:hypothetical protein FRC03_002400 [Tulasnella sp. 419]|nr:hypothetical protein FRC03_002400 [Tulasnella sp. 419]